MTETNGRGGRSRARGGTVGTAGKAAGQRAERQAKALRENLRRRKQQQRLRQGDAKPPAGGRGA